MTQADFESILRAHQAMVYSIAYHFFRNGAVAEEIAQDVFLQLYQTRQALASSAHVVAWLRRTTTHRCIDAARHHRRHKEVPLDDLPDVPDTRSERDFLLSETLRKMVASLPAKPRAVVILRYSEDMDVEDISRVLEMPVRTVWTHLRRAVALMRDKASRFVPVTEARRHASIR